MPLDQTWAVGNGAENSVEGARLSLYSATNGGRGVILPRDMKVIALPTPGPFVRVLSGGCVSPNDYLNSPGSDDGGGQSYAGREISSTDFPVAPTGSSGGQVKYLIWAVHDEQFERDLPDAPSTALRDNYEWVSTLNGITYPHAPLVKLDQPANTATITNSMLTDIREVANPKTWPVKRIRPNVASDNEWVTATGVDGELFPNNGGSQTIYIPKQATRVLIEAKLLDVRYASGKNAYGEKWVEYGPYARPSTRKYASQRFMYDTAASSNNYRMNWISGGDLYIPAELRGTEQVFYMKARKTGPDTGVSIDGMSGVIWDVTFLQVADPSTS